MEWFELDNYTKQSLLMIMTRGTIPIELTSAYVISMNLDSFVHVSIKMYDIINSRNLKYKIML